MCIAEVFTIVKVWKQMSTDGWVDKEIVVHTAGPPYLQFHMWGFNQLQIKNIEKISRKFH